MRVCVEVGDEDRPPGQQLGIDGGGGGGGAAAAAVAAATLSVIKTYDLRRFLPASKHFLLVVGVDAVG